MDSNDEKVFMWAALLHDIGYNYVNAELISHNIFYTAITRTKEKLKIYFFIKYLILYYK